MSLIEKTILPILIFISCLILIFNFTRPDIENFSLHEQLQLFEEYSTSTNFQTYMDYINTDLYQIRNYLSRNPIYDLENEEFVMYDPNNVNDPRNQERTNAFQRFIYYLKNTFHLVSETLSARASETNGTFLEAVNTVSYYVVGFLPFVASVGSLIFDVARLSTNFIIFTFNLLYL